MGFPQVSVAVPGAMQGWLGSSGPEAGEVAHGGQANRRLTLTGPEDLNLEDFDHA